MLFEMGVGNETHFPEAVMVLQEEGFQAFDSFNRKCHLLGKQVIAVLKKANNGAHLSACSLIYDKITFSYHTDPRTTFLKKTHKAISLHKTCLQPEEYD